MQQQKGELMRTPTHDDILEVLGSEKLKFDVLLKRLEQRLEDSVSYALTRAAVQQMHSQNKIEGDRNLIIIWKKVGAAPKAMSLREKPQDIAPEPTEAPATPARATVLVGDAIETQMERLRAQLVAEGKVLPRQTATATAD